MKSTNIAQRLPILKATLLTFILCIPSFMQANEIGSYELSLSFSPENNQLIGTAKISIPPGQGLQLFLDDLTISGSLLRRDDGSEYQLSHKGNLISLEPNQDPFELYLSYSYTARGNSNIISDQGISLTGNWFPKPKAPVRFKLSATLPEQFSAIVESDHFPLEQNGNKINAVYSTPTTELHFTAGPYIVQKLRVRDKFYVYTMFFKEDSDLSSDYLQAAKQYLLSYENTIGPFPYNHYAIVSNRLPTGYGIPTYTLIGQMVLRLPFIQYTSLRHEIVHSWFGNSVQVDYSSGNWCEGLTTFLADQQYREENGEGVQYRKETITKYINYVSHLAPMSLGDFRSADHSQPMADTKRAIGYNRGSLFFHELKQQLGEDSFVHGLRSFYHDNRGKKASWEDLRRSFEKTADADLSNFFQERLTRKDIPSISVEDIQLNYSEATPSLSFNLLQKTELPYTLSVPIQITTSHGTIEFEKKITKASTHLVFPLKQRPIKFTVDPEFSMLRQLSPRERVTVWSQFLGSKEKLAVVADDAAKVKYKPFRQILDKYEIQTVTAEEVTNADLSQHSLLLLGTNQASAKSLFGQLQEPAESFTLDVRTNPLNEEHVAVIAAGSSTEQVEAAAKKLRHYGKYSYLKFKNGRNLEKTIHKSQNGMTYVLETLPNGSSTKNINSFERIVEKLAEHRVIYIGESHTSLSDHLLQLRIIEAIHNLQPNLAIGMEMFPKSSQAALDRYTLQGDLMSEQDFLKESKYYDVWRYDYRFFRDIFNFAKNNRIPVLGLNLDRTVVSQVFKEGNTDGLDKATIETLPAERNLGLPGYKERLDQMYSIHTSDGHATGMQSGFIQAQALWDETMAENITQFLRSHPNHTMVVLAGSQHTRKDSGIPPRVYSRIAVEQASVLNVYNNSGTDNLSAIADYYFFSTEMNLPEKPKIGVILTSVTKDNQEGSTYLQIEQFSPHGKAKEAGLREGDILLRIQNVTISSMADVHIAMLDTKAGDKIEIDVLRTDDSTEHEITFQVELSLPQRPPGHP